MRPLRELVRHTLVYGLGSVGVSLIGFILIPVYTRYLTPEEYGTLALLLLLQAVLMRFYDLGLTNSVGRFYFDFQAGEGGHGLDSMISTVMSFLAAWGLVLSALVWGLAPGIGQWLIGAPGVVDLVRIVAATLFLEAVSIPALTLIRMEERSGLWVTISLLRVTGGLVLNIYLVVFAGMGVAGVLLSNAALAAGVGILTTLPLIRRSVARPSLAVLHKLLGFGLPFFPVLIGILIIDLSDRYLIQVLRSVEEVGVYSVGYKFGQIMLIGVSAFSFAFGPLRYRIMDRPDAAEIYARIATLFTAGACVLTVLVGVLADEVVQIATTPPFFAGAVVVAPVCLAYALYGLHLIMATGMGITKRTSGLAIGATLAAILNVGLNLLLIPRLGMVGAAASTLVAYAILVIVTERFSRRHYPIDFAWTRMLALLLFAVGFVALDRFAQPQGLVAGGLVGIALWLGFTALAFPVAGIGPGAIRAARRWAGEVWAGGEAAAP